jgi:cytochrome c oxidase cbb3-type subunit IV
MIREWLTAQGFQLGPAVALLLFLAVFVGMLVWIYRPGSRRIYDRQANLPFDEDAPLGGASRTPANGE